ncbi:MAG: phosphomannomutase [Gammaproteobacteria bacterium]
MSLETNNRIDRIFKAYDVRGRVPDDLDEEIAWRIGFGFANYLQARKVVIGYDVRPTSESLTGAFAAGMVAAGSEVSDIGLCGTEEVYFATFNRNMDGGVMVTASHNPHGWNGMKLVREEAKPLSGDEGLAEIKALAKQAQPPADISQPQLPQLSSRSRFVQHLLTYIDVSQLKPLKIVVNAGNGGAGLVIDALAEFLPFEFLRINHEPDGSFPNGIPNPLLPENRSVTANAVREHGADMGVAWDGDFDRCFLFDENANFVEGYYMIGLLSEQLLARHKGARIVYDPRCTWNTIEVAKNAGGVPVLSKTGHAFMKARLRKENAIYGGEMSAHHYFREFHYCDSGMIPWLLVAELLSTSGKPLSSFLAGYQQRFPVSGEINRRVQDPDRLLHDIEVRYSPEALNVDYTDGLSVEFEDWRFNLRKSNTEPVVRLNVEARQNLALLQQKTAELVSALDAAG